MQATANSRAGTQLEGGHQEPLKIARQISDVSTAAGKSPAGASCCQDDPCDVFPFHQLDSMHEDQQWSAMGTSDALSELQDEDTGAEEGSALHAPLWQDCQEPARICVGLPPLRSDLGRWAQWAVAAEEWQSVVLGTCVKYTYSKETCDPLNSDEE